MRKRASLNCSVQSRRLTNVAVFYVGRLTTSHFPPIRRGDWSYAKAASYPRDSAWTSNRGCRSNFPRYSHPQLLRNVFSAPTLDFSVNRSMAMADRSGLRLIGFLFATVTIAVMSTTVLIVKGQADANHLIENSSASMPLRRT